MGAGEGRKGGGRQQLSLFLGLLVSSGSQSLSFDERILRPLCDQTAVEESLHLVCVAGDAC